MQLRDTAASWLTAMRGRDGARSRALRLGWVAFLAIGLALTVVYFLLPSTEEQDVFYQLPEMLAVSAILFGIRLHRPASPGPWYLLAAGLSLTVAGDWTWLVLDRFFGIEPFPSVADALYLAGVTLLALAVWGMLRGRLPGGDRAGLLDGLIVTVSVGLLSWVYLMAPIVGYEDQSLLELAVALAYPLVDLLLLGVMVRLILAPGEMQMALRFIVAGLFAYLLADYQYAILALEDAYQVGLLIDAGWIVGAVLWGTAALHPSMRSLAQPVSVRDVQLTPRRLALLALASVLAPAVLVVEWISGRTLDVPVVAAGCVLLFGLVIARLQNVVADLRATLDERAQLEAELERRALHDPLTGLANRLLFHDRLSHALARRDASVAVMFLDLDDFKNINDSFGHAAGDEVLRMVADALEDTLRPQDTVARLGGDEFAVLIEDSPDRYTASLVAGRLLAAVHVPFQLGGQSRTVAVSIGISLGSGPDTDADALMRDADIAMYVAKGQGKGTFVVFEPTEHEGMVRGLELRNDLERALTARQFELDYQPIFDLSTGELAGMEALVRWNHPRQGRLMPADFVPLTETTGAIVPLGRWILREACKAAAAWPGQFVSVNLSAQQLGAPTFLADVQHVLLATGLPPNRLVLELTETARLDEEMATNAMGVLHDMGVRLAMDDFGTGFAALSQLTWNWFDIVKIDQTFVDRLGTDTRSAALVTGILDLARRLDMAVVAEGIEDGVQVARLREAGCQMGQGFHFARPMSLRAAVDFLEEHQGSAGERRHSPATELA